MTLPKVVEDVLKELKSGYGGSLGASKNVNQASFAISADDIPTDLDRLKGRLTIHFSATDVHDTDYSGQYDFDVTCQDMFQIAAQASNLKGRMQKIADDFAAAILDLKEDRKKLQEATIRSCEDGLTAAVVVKKQAIKFRPKG